MEFQDNLLVDRPLEIDNYLGHDFSLNRLVGQTGLNRTIIKNQLRDACKKLSSKHVNIVRTIESPVNENATTDKRDVVQLRVRQATDAYFDAVQSTNDGGYRNVILVGTALVLGVGALFFVCDCILNVYIASHLFPDFQNLFSR